MRKRYSVTHGSNLRKQSERQLALTLSGRSVPGIPRANRQAVMESIERTLGEHSGSFPDEGNTFIEPEKRKIASPKGEAS